MRVFCTYFDINYLSRGLAMMLSIYKHDKNIKFIVLCLDKKTENQLSRINLSFIQIEKIDFLFKKYPELKNSKNKRKKNEFCFLLTPYFIEYCLISLGNIKVFYVDSDIIFLDKCIKITNKINKFSVIASVHNFDKKNKFQEKINGIFNVGFLGFKRNKISLNCLITWKRQCLFSTTTNESFEPIIKGDQLYLNSWPKLLKKEFYPIKNKNFNIGGWNIRNYKINYKNNQFYLNNKKVLMFHANFIEFKEKNKIFIDNSKHLKLINNFICENYKNSSKLIKIHKIIILRENLIIKFFNQIKILKSFFS